MNIIYRPYSERFFLPTLNKVKIIGGYLYKWHKLRAVDMALLYSTCTILLVRITESGKSKQKHPRVELDFRLAGCDQFSVAFLDLLSFLMDKKHIGTFLLSSPVTLCPCALPAECAPSPLTVQKTRRIYLLSTSYGEKAQISTPCVAGEDERRTFSFTWFSGIFMSIFVKQKRFLCSS